MKNITLISLFIAALSVGCQHGSETVVTGADGSKAVVHNDGSMHVDGANGASVDVSKNGDTQHYEATDKDGNKVTENITGNGVSMQDSKGNSVQMNPGAVSEEALGLPFYPGSEESKSGMTALSDTPEAKTAMSTRSSKDDPDKIQAFYKDKVPGAAVSSATMGDQKIESVSGKLANGSDVSIAITKKGTEDTQILVTVSVKKTKA